eukprot:162683_1
MIDDTQRKLLEIDALIANYSRCVIPDELKPDYPMLSLFYITGDNIKSRVDMKRLDSKCPEFLSWNKPHNASHEAWQNKMKKRRLLRKNIIRLNNDLIVDTTKCVLPITNYCKACGASKWLTPLITCRHCNEMSHLKCNGIPNRATEYYTENNLDFYCHLNKCDALLVPLQNQKKKCKVEMTLTIKKIGQTKKSIIIEELKHHNVYTGRSKQHLKSLRGYLIKHYKDHHFIKYKKVKSKSERNRKKVKYETMDIDTFLKWFHCQHGLILKAMLEAIYTYIRIPDNCMLSRRCFDFKVFRKRIGVCIGSMFSDYSRMLRDITRLKRIESGQILCAMSKET